MPPESDIVDALKAGGFLPPDAAPRLEPLTGGVSSDVFRLDTAEGPVCVKQALAKLRVAANWRAPVERSHYEVEWLKTARPLVGAAVPEVLFEDQANSLFVMSFYDPATHSVWKSELAAGRVDPTFAGQVGRMLAAIHAGAAGRPEIAAAFQTTALFEDLRLSPFLRHAATAHADLASRLVALADRTAATRITLVHGDVSPKNILCGPQGPVLLDAECAWYGDPAFDLAFCSAHLLLKTVWKPAHAAAYLDAFYALQRGYLPGVSWESAADLDSRAAPLTAAILLARVDGKSPAEPAKRRGSGLGAGRRAPPDPRRYAGDGGAGRYVERRPGGKMKTTITAVRGRQIWDSRGRPTVEAEVTLAGGVTGRAMAPAGASRGAHEAIDLRDGGARFGGLGVDRATAAVNGEIARLLTGWDAADQAGLDAAVTEADGTPNLARLGGNAAVAVSLAALHAAAGAQSLPLWAYLAEGRRVRIPLPEIQIFGGGAHAGRRTDVQDFMIMTPKVGTIREAFEITADVFRAAGRLMEETGRLAGAADEGGWWPMFDSNEDALTALVQAIEMSGHRPGEDVYISLDVAANELDSGDGRYRMGLDGTEDGREAMVERVAAWVRRYPILSIEDPVSQDDLEGFTLATRAYGERVQVIGDDLLVTNADRVRAAAAAGAGNAVLVKVNQAGTVSRAKAALDAARTLGWGTIVSARSGETEDVSIAHLATGWDAGQIKVGSFSRSERMAKWNELLRIEEAMGDDAVFAGPSAFAASVGATLA